jgi:phosphotransferase system enzyme I (PtsI)
MNRPKPKHDSIVPGRRNSDEPIRLRGICGSPGVAFGRVTIFDRQCVPIPRRVIGVSERDAEIDRLMRAIATSRRHLEEARDALDPAAGAENRLVIESHLLMHRDELLVGAAAAAISTGHNAEWAVRRSIEAIVKRLSSAREPYLSERARDVEQVGEHLLRILTGVGLELPRIESPTILVASDLSPAEIAGLPRALIRALVTDLGTATSHTAILARALGIPAIVGVDGVTRTLTPEMLVVVDALRGEIIIEPDIDEQRRAEEREERYRHFKGKLRAREPSCGRTRDGTRVELLANVELEIEVEKAIDERAEGIGLYRTEFLYLGRELPSEERQTELYSRIASRMAPSPVTLRTYDLGADKLPTSRSSASPLGRSLNPALGLRGLRFSLAEPDLFRVQLRAMMQASAIAPLRVMFPMVCTLDDFRRARDFVEETREELDREGVVHGPLAIGAMIEVPSAVTIVRRLARECDFLSVGTNDLVQYTLAIDRQNPRISHLVRPLEPVILQLLENIRCAATDAGIPVSICGDLASNAMAIPVLLGLGYRSLSGSPSDLPVTREILGRVDLGPCEELARTCIECETSRQAERAVFDCFGGVLGDIWDEQGIELTQ